jgi:putative NIF3 family GTP cyclohydrolase 1 type 2
MKLGELLQWTAELAGFDEVPADSQVYLENTGDARRVLFGIDTSIAELMFAKQSGYDALIAHHPLGEQAVTDFHKVVQRQVEQMTAAGVDKSLATTAVSQRLERPHRARHMSNINALVDTGRLIGLPFCNIHLACDEIGRQLIAKCVASKTGPDATVGDAIAALNSFTEIRNGLTTPEAWVGGDGNLLGKWVVAMAGGTNGGYPVFSEYWNAGVNTIFAMHCAEDDLAKLRAHAGPQQNLVVTGHMATDSIGINRVIAAMEERGISVTRTSGIVAP